MTDIECYPWAAPTEEQKNMFDQLPPDQQLEMIRQAIIEGEESGNAGLLDMEEIRRKAKQEVGLLPKDDQEEKSRES